MAQAQGAVVRAFGLGAGVWALWLDLDRKKARIRHYDARMVIPLTWNEDGISEYAFVTRAFYRKKAAGHLQMHLKGGMGFAEGYYSPSESSSGFSHGLIGMESDSTYRIAAVCFDESYGCDCTAIEANREQ